jgi:glucose-1-phosphate adenylyltransferase
MRVTPPSFRHHENGRTTAFVSSSKSRRTLPCWKLRMPPRPLRRTRTRHLRAALPGIHGHLRLQPQRCWIECLDNTHNDFGKHIIPARRSRTAASMPTTSKATGRTSAPSVPSSRPTWTSANWCRSSTSSTPQHPIFTHSRFLPATKINGGTIREALLADGCILTDAHIETAVIGVRSKSRAGTTIRDRHHHGRRLLRRRCRHRS